MNPRNLFKNPTNSVADHDTFLERIVLHLQRTRKFSTNSSQKLEEKTAISIHSLPYNKFNHSQPPAFTNRHTHPAELEGDSSDSSCRFHFFHLYLNLAYSLLIVPYRPIRQLDGHYRLTKNRFQKVLCVASCMLVAFRQFTIIRTTWGRKFYHPIIFYFHLAHEHLHFMLTGVFYWSFYANPNFLENLLEKIGHCYLLSPSADKRNKIWFAVIFLHIVFPFMGFLSPVVGHDVIESWSWTPSWLFRSYVSKARYAFFLCTDVNLIADRPEWSEITNNDLLFTSFYILIICLNELQAYLQSLIFGICLLTLWTASTAFKKSIQLVNLNQRLLRDRKHAQATVMYFYYELKGLSNSMNQAWSLFCFFYIIDIIPFLATDLDFGLRAMDWFDALKMSRSVFFFGWNIVISAETYRKSQWFMGWLLKRENRDLFTHNIQELTLLLEELRTQPVGMGASGFYQITYAFGAQVCITIITMFIITLQYADLHPNAASWWT